MTVVVDSSVTLAWLYSDEITVATQRVFEMVLASGAVVPSIWRLEVANSLQTSVRRKRIDAAFREGSLVDLALLDIQTDPDTDEFAWSTTLRLAERLQLTVYDATYLELAQRRSLPLATLDHQLRKAAETIAVSLLGVD
jgi:predicted nucleic acid-binding protein